MISGHYLLGWVNRRTGLNKTQHAGKLRFGSKMALEEHKIVDQEKGHHRVPDILEERGFSGTAGRAVVQESAESEIRGVQKRERLHIAPVMV